MLFFTGYADDDEPSNSQQYSKISAHSEESQDSSSAIVAESESKVIVTPAASSADWNLVLVNRENQLAEEIVMELYLTESGYQIDSRIQEPYLQLMGSRESCGYGFHDGFRLSLHRATANKL